ncbi:MAG: hypothetical protein ACSHWU_12400 [Marinicella sp.]
MKLTKIFTFILIMMISTLIQAGSLIITKSFTGGWHDPAKNGQGFLIEIIKSNNQKMALTTWFTFDTSGNQYWLIGVGEIEDQSINFQMMLPEGGRFGDLHNPSNMTNTLWGEVKFTFNDCNNGTVNWEPVIGDFNAGTMPVTRSTAINNLNCTGGLFDDLGDTNTDTEVMTPLVSTGLDTDAKGKTKYEQRTDRIDYSVEIEDLPVGVYQLFVGDVNKGDIEVVTLAGGFNEGEIEFRDPVEPGKLPLDFDPRGQIIDIVQNDLVYLTSGGTDGGGNSGADSSQDAPPFGDSETEIYMTNTGVVPLGKAKTKLKQRADRVEFQIEIEDVPLGFYDFNVNGSVQGVVEVIQTPIGIEGELEFRNPVEAGKELLDFNPLGTMLSVTQGPDVLFTLNFPETAGNGGSDDDDDNCDSSSSNDDCDDSDDNDCENGSSNDDCDDSDDNDCDSDSSNDDCDDSDDNDCDSDSSNDDCDDDGGLNTQLVDIEVDFNNSGVNTSASGSVEYEVRSDRRDFKVEVEDLEFGTYQLLVGGQIITSLEVNTNEVELEFRDPVEPGKIPLNFDPLNQLIEIKQGGTVYLSVVLR